MKRAIGFAFIIGLALAAGVPIYAHVQEKNAKEEQAKRQQALVAARQLRIKALEIEIKNIKNAQYIVQNTELEAIHLHSQSFEGDEFLRVHKRIQDIYFTVRNQSPTAFQFFPAITAADPESISKLRQAMSNASIKLNDMLATKLGELQPLIEQNIADSKSEIKEIQRRFREGLPPN